MNAPKVAHVHHIFHSYVECFPYDQKEVRRQRAALPNSALDRERGSDFPVEMDSSLRARKQ
jgi:hypothetical protein